MRRIKILNRSLRADENQQLKALAKDAGFSEDEIESIDAVGEPDPNCDDEIVLILASAELCADPALEADLATTQRGGRRAICMWPNEGDGGAQPPDAMKKYAYSIIRFDADRLRVVTADDDQLCFESPDGKPLPKPETERNLCVDEKAIPK